MSNITPYQFEGANVRTLDIDGEPWFVGKDVASILGYVNETDALNTHCRGVAKRYPIPDALGRAQETRLISEADMLRLVVNSTLPAAERFERWVFEQVLPSIRKTGSYTMPQTEQTKPARASERYREAAVITREQLKICKLLGVDDGMAKVITAKEVRNVTGLDFTPLLTNVTATQNPRLTVKQLTERIGGGAKSEQVNAALEGLGFQTKKHWTSEKGEPRSKWELTEAGQQYGALAPYQAEQNEHSGYRVVWHADVLELVQPLVLTAIADRAAAKKPKRAKPAAAPAPAPEPQGALL